MRRTALTLTALVLLAAACAAPPVAIRAGAWRAVLESPGGDLSFGLDLEPAGDSIRAWIVNGKERIEVPEVTLVDRKLAVRFPLYDSRIVADLDDDGAGLSGEWTRRAGPEEWSVLPFRAKCGERMEEGNGAGEDAAAVAGTWVVDFSRDDQPAVGRFEAAGAGRVTGTFLTTGGDYRYLAGRFDGTSLSLSTFDGAHAFLFKAEMSPDGTLAGDFWSRDTWHETWTARRDPEAGLPDSFSLTSWSGDASLGDLFFPDLEGRPRALNDPAFAGQARLIQIFGTWCPNCNDAASFMGELAGRYESRGLSILGLAFEMTGDFSRDAEQVRIYAERHGLDFPILLAGLAGKEQASEALPILDKIRAYPTFIFLDGGDKVVSIYSGFSGPATGPDHARLRESFELILEELLVETDAS